jgi:very-short-patch-repair endonuclease
MPRRDPEKLARARGLRANMSPPERALWAILRAHRLDDVKFSRQIECGPFYIDFAARRERLGIELDGDSHGGREKADARRTAFLERHGWRIIRFTNGDVMTNAEGVARAILNALGRDFGESV